MSILHDYQIIGDSCLDTNPALIESLHLESVPLTISVEDKHFVDDESIVISELLEAMHQSKKVAKSACPPPMEFLERYKQKSNSFVITLSSKLSGTYNSAVIAAELFLSECKDKLVHVFDSKSAASGELLIAMKIGELIEKKLSFEAIVEAVTAFIDSMCTFFVLDNLDNLRKNGRMSLVSASLASLFSIRPIMGDDGDGQIKMFDKARGFLQALDKMIELMPSRLPKGEKLTDRTLVISHCNAKERAEYIKEGVKKYSFKDVIIVPTKGISSLYANEGGVVIAY